MEASKGEAWEEYYSALSQLPERLRKPVPFIAEALPLFNEHGVKAVLDLGCGAGRHCVYLAKKDFDIIGLDVSRSALKIAKEWIRTEKLENVAFVRASITNLPFKNFCFDTAISVSVIHHALKADIKKTIDEVHRVLKENRPFLTNLLSTKDYRYGEGRKMEDRTFAVLEDFDEKSFQELHHFFTKRETATLFARFTETNIEPLTGGKKGKPHHYWKVTTIK